jgi:hypothetical protein
MDRDPVGHAEWAEEQLATASFGHKARVARAVLMLKGAAQRPAGRLTDVFTTPADLQAAYDFVEGEVRPEAITRAFAEATVRALGKAKSCYVPFDGSSLTLTDYTGNKGFGAIGALEHTRGIKVIDAIAVSEQGTPVGLLDLHWWARGHKAKSSRFARRRAGQTETRHWLETIETVCARFADQAPHCTPWFLGDRECDNTAILRSLAQPGRAFIVRAAQDRFVRKRGGRCHLRSHMKRRRICGRYMVEVPAGPHRQARRAVMAVRFADVVLDLPDRTSGGRVGLRVRVVWASESRPPAGEKALDWMLLTSANVRSFRGAKKIVYGYCHRWRVEDFHKSWKTGCCNVEQTQLRDISHVLRWATMLASVAMRVERLKHLARNQPDLPATAELSKLEIDALRAAKTRVKKRTEVVPDDLPTIAQAVRWIADLGGYTGKSSGGPPGSITVARGLEVLRVWTAALAYLRAPPKRRGK